MKKIKEYLLDEIKQIKDNGEITVETSLRRLALIYDWKNFENYKKNKPHLILIRRTVSVLSEVLDRIGYINGR